MKAEDPGDAEHDEGLQAAVEQALTGHLSAHLTGRPAEGPGAAWRDLPDTLAHDLARWCAALAAANERVNLTGLTAPDDMALRHALASLTALEGLPPPADPPLRLLDLGSGGGAPGIPLALARPDLVVFLAESRGRKAAALQDIVTALGLGPRVSVVNARAEAWLTDHGVDVIVTRAVGSLQAQLQLLAPLRAGFGRLLAMKGPAGDDELEAVRPRLARLGFAAPRRLACELPGGAGKRLLFVFSGGRPLSRPG